MNTNIQQELDRLKIEGRELSEWEVVHQTLTYPEGCIQQKVAYLHSLGIAQNIRSGRMRVEFNVNFPVICAAGQWEAEDDFAQFIAPIMKDLRQAIENQYSATVIEGKPLVYPTMSTVNVAFIANPEEHDDEPIAEEGEDY